MNIILFNIGFLDVRWIDFLDIFLVGFLLYQLYKLLKGSIASKIFIGLLTVYGLYLIVKAVEMDLLTTILDQFAGVGIVSTIILFQQEIRKFLLMVGKTTTLEGENLLWKRNNDDSKRTLEPIIEAAKVLSISKTGALMVFAKTSQLKFYAESGEQIDSVISKRLLLSIFNKNSPLHDGAVIFASDRIKAARCVLPISDNDTIPVSLGMRHRAAFGMSEITDSVVLIISEETGYLSITYQSKIYYNLTAKEVEQRLFQILYASNDDFVSSNSVIA